MTGLCFNSICPTAHTPSVYSSQAIYLFLLPRKLSQSLRDGSPNKCHKPPTVTSMPPHAAAIKSNAQPVAMLDRGGREGSMMLDKAAA